MRRWIEESLGRDLVLPLGVARSRADVVVADLEGIERLWKEFSCDPQGGWPGVVLACSGLSDEPAREGGSPDALLTSIVDDLVRVGCSRAELRRRVANVAAVRAFRIERHREHTLRSVVRALVGPSLTPALAVLNFGAELLCEPEPPWVGGSAGLLLARASRRTQIATNAVACAAERLGGRSREALTRQRIGLGTMIDLLGSQVFGPGRLEVERRGDSHCHVNRTLVQALVLAWAGPGGHASLAARVRICGGRDTVVLGLRRVGATEPARDPARRGPHLPDLRALTEFVAVEHDAPCELTVDGISEATLHFSRTATGQGGA